MFIISPDYNFKRPSKIPLVRVSKIGYFFLPNFGEIMPAIVLITGASHGIGLATTEHLAKAGYKVYATCRDPLTAENLQHLAQQNSNISILSLDVNLDDSVNKAVSAIFKIEGTIDVVVNNAGFGVYGPSEMHTIEEMRKIFDTNVLGAMRINQAVVPIMRKQLHGRIINIGSISGAIPSKNMPLYSASKAALESLTASDAHRFAPWNIKVSLIQPGPVVTNFEPRTHFGSRFSKMENPYDDTLSEDREKWKKIMDGGQSPFEVAQVIQAAIESPEPKLWYQTSKAVTEAISKHFKDMTGNSRIPQPALRTKP